MDYVFYFSYSYNTTKIEQEVKKDQEAQNIYTKFHAKQKMAIVGEKQYSVIWTPPIRMAFLVHLIVRICLEILFIIIAYILQTKQTNKVLLQEVRKRRN